MPRDVFFLNPRTEKLRHFKLRYFVLRFARSDTPVDDVIPEQNDDEREAGQVGQISDQWRIGLGVFSQSQLGDKIHDKTSSWIG